MPFCLATALARGRLNPEDFTDNDLGDPTVQSLIRVATHVPGSTALTVRLRDGTKLTESLRHPSNLIDADQIEAKFHRSTGKILTDRIASDVIEMVQRLEQLASLRELTQKLRTSIC
jgi:hypothetical protein